MKNILITGICFVLFFFCATVVNGQHLSLEWKFQTGDDIIATPLISEQVAYFGSEDGNFYAINVTDGKELWHFNTRDRILGTATLIENIVIFESGNTFYALDKMTGLEVWKFDPGSALWGYKIDPWDFKRSTAIVHDSLIFIGSSLGYIFGLDIHSGKKVLSIASEHQSPIRTPPSIKDDIIYFGDWAGKIYAYDLKLEKLLWKKKTYEKKPYDSFGGIVSNLLIHENKLFFGARNHELQVLDIRNGEKVWSYLDTNGGWIFGDPVIENNVLFIGGSDNHKMFAFNPENGKLLWTFNSKRNNYTRPILTPKYVIFTCGDGYNLKNPGKLFVINREDGTFVKEFEVPEAAFSAPAWDGKNIYFGSCDGGLYKVAMR